MVNNGATPTVDDPEWAEQASGEALTVLPTDCRNKTLWIKQVLTSDDDSITPTLSSMTITIDGKKPDEYYSDGYRICPGLPAGIVNSSLVQFATSGATVRIYAMATADHIAPSREDPAWEEQAHNKPLTVITPGSKYGYLWLKAEFATADPYATPSLSRLYVYLEIGGMSVRVQFGLSENADQVPGAWYDVPNGGMIPFLTGRYECLDKYLWAKVLLKTDDMLSLPEVIDLEIEIEGKNAIWGYRRGTFEYLTDYRCGDIVHAEHRGVASMEARIIEVKEEYTPEIGESHTITLGREKPDLMKMIREQRKELGPEIRR